MTFPFPVFCPSVKPAAVAYVGNGASASDLTTYSIAGINFGAAAADRYLVAAISVAAGAARTFSGAPTIGGIAASSVVEQASVNAIIGLFIAAVPSGTSGDVNFTMNAACLRAAVTVWQLKGLLSATPTATAASAASPPSAAIAALAGGVIIGGAAGYATASQSWTWTGLTEDFDSPFQDGSNWQIYSAASAAFASSSAPTISATKTGANTNDAMVLAAFR